MSYQSTIPLSDQFKYTIVKAISDGNKKDILDFDMEYDLETSNNIHFLKWDFTNTNLIRSLYGERFQCLKVKRGSWKFVLIYDKETKFLYSLMKGKRFAELQERASREKVHYLDSLASINEGLKGNNKIKIVQQLSLFAFDDQPWQSNVQSLLKEMIQNINGEIINLVLISFSTEKYELTSVSAYIPTSDLEIAYEENWNEFIPADFDTLSIIAGSTDQDDEDEIEVGLREGVIPNQNDDIVQLRNDQKEQNDDEAE